MTQRDDDDLFDDLSPAGGMYATDIDTRGHINTGQTRSYCDSILSGKCNFKHCYMVKLLAQFTTWGYCLLVLIVATSSLFLSICLLVLIVSYKGRHKGRI